jgi:prevent-host-death family protein
MNKIIGVTELQRHFRRIFDEVVRTRVPYILTRDSRPEAVLIPYDEFVRHQQADEAEREARVTALQARLDRVAALDAGGAASARPAEGGGDHDGA